MIVFYELSWLAPRIDRDILGWRIYAGPPGMPGWRGRCIAHTCRPEETSAGFPIEEGQYTFTISRIFHWGEEGIGSALRVERVVSAGRSDAPSAIANGVVAHVAGGGAALLRADHAPQDDPEALIEVIEGASVEQGRLIYRGPQHRKAADEPTMPADLLGRPVPLDGSGRDASRTLWMRAVSVLGVPEASPSSRTVRYFDRPDTYRVAICGLAGGTLDQISAAAATDPWELSGGKIRLRRKPTVANATTANGWGTVASGLLASSPAAAKYLTQGYVESAEKDLGASRCFFLEFWDDVERASATAIARPVRALKFPVDPNTHPVLQGSADGPAWWGRRYRQDGKPRRALEECRWDVKFGDSSPISMDYRPAIHGEQIKARYIRVRRLLRDPAGLHQVQVTNLKAEALYPYHSDQGEVQVVAPASSATVTTRVNPATGASDLFGLALIPVVTAKALGAWWPRVTAINLAAGQFTVQLQDAAGVAYTGGGNVYWHVRGY